MSKIIPFPRRVAASRPLVIVPYVPSEATLAREWLGEQGAIDAGYLSPRGEAAKPASPSPKRGRFGRKPKG